MKLQPKEKDKPFPFVQLGDKRPRCGPGTGRWRWANPFSLAMDFTPTVHLRPHQRRQTGTSRRKARGFWSTRTASRSRRPSTPATRAARLFNMNGELIGNQRAAGRSRSAGPPSTPGVGYAISINQIKNFMGHLRAGIDSDPRHPRRVGRPPPTRTRNSPRWWSSRSSTRATRSAAG